MRVLWLCNIMLPRIAEQLHREVNNKEGWLSGLADACLRHQAENDIALAVAFPVAEELDGTEGADIEKHDCDSSVVYCKPEDTGLSWYAFCEDTVNPHVYDARLEDAMRYIVETFQPDVVHCFGTEYPHTLAMCRVVSDKSRLLIGIQGLCKVYADAYFADLPDEVIRSVTLRDVLKRDSLIRQQQKFAMRGEMEAEAIALAGNVTGRTAWDRYYTEKWNPKAGYFPMNETLRANFYTGQWDAAKCEPHAIFLSQGDYPIKGLHYMLLALPAIRERFPDVKVYVAGNGITGDGSLIKRLKVSAYGKYLRDLIRQYHLEDRICFLGRLSAEQMKERYLKSNLFVCCSSIENSPNSLGEAMILGMPCVSADVGGIGSIFTDGEDGILYHGFRADEEQKAREDQLKENAGRLSKAVIEMFQDPSGQLRFGRNAREHALVTHAPERNYQRLVEIYREIAGCDPAAGEERQVGESLETKFVFVSNYINHHQIPFCNAMYRLLGGSFVFIQTEPMEEERIRMGWQAQDKLPYVKYYYEEPEVCALLIRTAETVLYGGVDEESYIVERLQSGRPVIRYSERLYKEGQWKAVSPRGLLKKYKDHTKYRNAPVWLLCAGAYVPSDFHIVRAYPGKMFQWGYFPETRHYDVDRLMEDKEPGSILWAARFLDWKHPELPLKCAGYLKEKGYKFHLNLVGGGEMQSAVDALMQKYDLADVVTLLGYKTPEEVRRLMERTQIYLTTSDRKEGWGAVVNEAMNSGCAVVADHMMGAVPYLIRHGVNGFVYEDGKEEQLFAQVERLLADREVCEKAGREAYRTITEVWNAEQAAGRLLKLAAKLENDAETGIAGRYVPEDPGAAEESCAAEKSGAAGKSGAADGSGTPESSCVLAGPCAPAEVIPEKKMLRKMLWNRQTQSR